jgi:uncharacterized membrane protein
MNDAQTKLMEILAAGGLSIASIFFAVLAGLFGGLVTVQRESERRPLRRGIWVTYTFVVVSIGLTATTLLALRFKTGLLYALSVALLILTVGGMLLVATFILWRARTPH